MPSKNPAQRLRDIIDNIDAIGAFTAQLDFPEASKRLPGELRRHPEIDWAAVAASGNVYRHEYEAVDEALLWHTVQHDLAELRSVAVAEFDRLPPAGHS